MPFSHASAMTETIGWPIMQPDGQPKMSQRGKVWRFPVVTVSIIELTVSETTSGRSNV